MKLKETPTIFCYTIEMEKLNRRDFLKTVTGALAGSVLNVSVNETIKMSEFPSKEAIACTVEFNLADGEVATLIYMRKGRHEVMKGSSSLKTNIYVTYFDEGRPVGGTNVAEYIEGQWKINPEILE